MTMAAVDVCALEANSTCKLRSVIKRYMIFGTFNVHGLSCFLAATGLARRCASTCWRSSSRSCTCPATLSPSPFWASSKLKRSRVQKLGLVVMIMCQVGRKWHWRRRRRNVKERELFQGNFFFPTYMAYTPVLNFYMS